METQRRYERFNVDLMKITGKMVLAKYMKIVNISIGGICFQTEKRLSIDSQYTVRLDGKGRTLSMRGTVVWSVLKESSRDARGNIVPMYMAGMKFTDMSEEKVGALADFIEAHRHGGDKKVDLFSTSGLRLFVRIRIDDPEKAAVDYNYRVKNLSIGGMLMESAHALELGCRLRMEMTLPDYRFVKFTGRVAFCQRLQTDIEGYDVGIDFAEISGKDRDRLAKFLTALGDTNQG